MTHQRSTPSLRRVLAAAALLAGGGGALAATPAAADPATARFTATYEATMTTTWNLPRYEIRGNCFHTAWKYGSGKEVWRIRTRGPQKVMAMAISPKFVSFLGGWKVGGQLDDIDAAGFISRDSHVGSGRDAGPCQGAPGVDPKRPDDCGDRLPSYVLHLGYLGRSMSVLASPKNAVTNQRTGYDDCWLPTAPGLAGGTWPSGINGRLERSAVFGRAKTLTVRGKRAWSEPHHESHPLGQLSTTTTVDWKLVLRRAR